MRKPEKDTSLFLLEISQYKKWKTFKWKHLQLYVKLKHTIQLNTGISVLEPTKYQQVDKCVINSVSWHYILLLTTSGWNHVTVMQGNVKMLSQSNTMPFLLYSPFLLNFEIFTMIYIVFCNFGGKYFDTIKGVIENDTVKHLEKLWLQKLFSTIWLH